MKRRVLAIALIPTILICGVITFVGFHRSYKVDLASGAMRADLAFFGVAIPGYSTIRQEPLEFMPKHEPIWKAGGTLVNGYCLHGTYGATRSRYFSAYYAMENLELHEANRRWIWLNLILLTEQLGPPSFVDLEYCENAVDIIAEFTIEYDPVRITLWPPTPLPRSLTASPRSLPPIASPPPPRRP